MTIMVEFCRARKLHRCSKVGHCSLIHLTLKEKSPDLDGTKKEKKDKKEKKKEKKPKEIDTKREVEKRLNVGPASPEATWPAPGPGYNSFHDPRVISQNNLDYGTNH